MRTAVPAVVLLTAASLHFLLPRFDSTQPCRPPPLSCSSVLAAAASADLRPVPRLLPPAKPPHRSSVQSQGPTVEKLEQAVASRRPRRVQVADILVAEGQRCRGSWLLKGDAARFRVNLGQAKITDKREDTKQATIILPEPGILDLGVDHSRTRTWAVDRLVWLPWHADQDGLRDAVMAEAQRLVEHRLPAREHPGPPKWPAERSVRGALHGGGLAGRGGVGSGRRCACYRRAHGKLCPGCSWDCARAGHTGSARSPATCPPELGRHASPGASMRIPGLGEVAERRPADPRRVDPATAANHAERARGRHPSDRPLATPCNPSYQS